MSYVQFLDNIPIWVLFIITTLLFSIASELETDQKFAGLDSLNKSVKPNADGSYTMWFGPKAPKGYEENWI